MSDLTASNNKPLQLNSLPDSVDRLLDVAKCKNFFNNYVFNFYKQIKPHIEASPNQLFLIDDPNSSTPKLSIHKGQYFGQNESIVNFKEIIAIIQQFGNKTFSDFDPLPDAVKRNNNILILLQFNPGTSDVREAHTAIEVIYHECAQREENTTKKSQIDKISSKNTPLTQNEASKVLLEAKVHRNNQEDKFMNLLLANLTYKQKELLSDMEESRHFSLQFWLHHQEDRSRVYSSHVLFVQAVDEARQLYPNSEHQQAIYVREKWTRNDVNILENCELRAIEVDETRHRWFQLVLDAVCDEEKRLRYGIEGEESLCRPQTIRDELSKLLRHAFSEEAECRVELWEKEAAVFEKKFTEEKHLLSAPDKPVTSSAPLVPKESSSDDQ